MSSLNNLCAECNSGTRLFSELFFAKAKSQVRILPATTTQKATSMDTTCCIGGEGEIRTLETLAGLTVFKTVSLNHSDTSPSSSNYNRDKIRLLDSGGESGI